MEISEYLKDILTFLGFVLNLLGAYKLYHSIKAFPGLLMDISDTESYPIATLDRALAKRGILFIIFGFILQLLPIIIKYILLLKKYIIIFKEIIMNVCFYLSDKFIFPLFEGVFLFLFIYALLHEKKRSNREVTRGKESWDKFTLAFGINSIVLMQIINSADALYGYKTIISITNLLMLIYLIFFNGWCRNKIIGLITKSQKKKEKH